ncbi:unnamed protein product [Knipowitschia caucasica]
MPEMTETQTSGRKPKKKKNKESHNAVERHRKEKINAGISRIGNLLPCSQALKQSKIMILDQAFRYITELKKQNDTMLLEGAEKTQASEIRRLRLQLEDMRKESAHYIQLLKAHDILEDPTVHWKGKQRCNKISNVTSQIQKGIIVYSNGKDLDSRAQPMETLVLQQQSEASAHLRVNGALVQVNTSSSAPSLLPSSAVTAPRAIEQCVVETPALASSLPPSVSYITLQIPTVTTALPQPQPAAAVQTLTIASTSASPLPSESAIVPLSSLTSLTPSIRAARSTTSLASLDPAIRTVAYTAVPNSQPFFRAQAAGSTQTTWTTLQMAGNTVQPVCQSISPPDDAPNVQQMTVCQPIQVQMQPSASAQQTPCQIKSQLQPTILSQRQSVAPQNPCAVLSPSAIMSQPAVMAHTAVVSQPAVIQPAALVTHSPALLSQPPLVPQAQPAVLPLLQTMQVLQVKTANSTAPGVTAPQSTNNQSVVILQQANNCPAQAVVREEITNSTPCQHIVIIQAPNPSAPTPQNVSVVPPAVPSVPAASTSITSTGSTSVTSPQTVGGKQLVHILPRPVQPQQNKCQPVSQSTTSTPAPATPQTITVNGQVFALQPVKTSENLISNCGQTTLQLIQPTTTEEPTTNVALNSLGALSSLNQSISQGIPISISGQNNLSSSSIIQQQPTNATSGSESAVTLPIQRPCLKPIKPAIVAKSPKNTVRKCLPAKKIKKIRQVKNQEQKIKPPAVILAKTTPVTSTSQILPNDLKNSTPENFQSNSSSIGVTSTAISSITQSMNVTITQNTDPSSNVAISQNGISVSCHSSLPNDSAKTTNLINKSNTTGLLTAVADIPTTVSVSSTVNEIKTSIPSENISTVANNSTVVKMQKESSSIQNKIILASSEQKDSSCGISTQLRLTCPNSTSNVMTSSVCIPQESLELEPVPCSRPGPTASVSTTMPPFTNTMNLTPLPSSREKNNVSDVNCLIQRTCQPPEVKPAQSGRGNSQEGHNKTDKIHPIIVNFDLDSKKDLTHNQQIYTNLDDQTPDSSLALSRQTDSPLSSASGGRGFSVASMLPQGHNLSAASGSFSSFVLTSEQAEMLALAMLEQDSPDRKTAVCTGNKTGTSNPNTGTWEPTKPSSVSTAKDCGSVARQEKMNTSMDTLKTASCPPIRGQDEGTMGRSRNSQNLSYSHSQTVLQPQNTMQNSTVASLSVNNLIRTSSSQPPYPGSPNMTSVPSPVCTTAHISQQSNAALSPCSASAQLTPLKTALLRSQAGLNMAERVKIIPKRQAQEEVIMNSGKRAKQCPLSGNTVNQMEVKGLDHSQLMGAQLPPISSSIMNRMNNESSGPLFTNSFMSPVVRPSETHCSAPGLSEQSQPGVLHVPQGHLQHHTPQPVPNLGGNHYMKQQQDQRHLYHLQQHLTQPDVLQHHSLHQRALQQQEQQQQHAQKKRGLVRGNQASSPAALQQKQQQAPPHHHQPSQHSSSQQHPSQHPQQHQQHQQQLQNSHSRHQQHLQQQLHQQHFRHQDKSCDAPVSRAHHSGHLPQQDHHKPAQDHNAMQRMMSSRSLEQTLISPPTNPVSRSSELVCAPSRQERQRVSNYSAEALIGKSSTNDQRMSLHLQPGRGAAQEQPDLRGYLDSSRTKANITHNPLNRIPTEHSRPVEGQRVSMGAPHQVSSFEVQVSRGNEISVKSGPPAQRGPQGPQLGGFRTGAGPPADGRNRAVYNALPASQVQVGLVQDGCHQSFMQSLLSPHLPEQSVHNQVAQCCPPVSMEYCVPRSTSTELQAKTSSSSVSQNQKAPGMRLGESNKGHISLGSNLHSGVRTALSHAPNSSAEAGRSSAPSRTPAAVAQHTRHITRDTQPSKLRAGDRTRSGTVRSTNPFESEGPLSLPSGGGVLLGRPQTGAEARRSTIVRFMPDTAQGPADNNLVPDQHLTQNFGFPFIPEGGMNPPPAINANSTIIPPMSQQNAPRTPSLLPVEAQNTLPSFYPSYSPAAHPSLPSDVTLQYFPNQMFTSPSADKSSAPPLNNRFGSILSPPRPVGFGQTNFPLLTDMTPMPIANSSGITPHISNFSLTSLFPEIATGMPSDGSAMPMSPLLSLSNTSSDAGKQPNRPAHNISHILGHDGSSAV